MIIYFDGQYPNVNPQVIDAFTPGIFKAKGVFETMLGLDGVVFDTALHLKRLRQGLKVLGIKTPVIDQSLFRKLLTTNQLVSARVRVMVWQAPPVAGQAVKQVHVMAVALPCTISNKKSYKVCILKTNRPANDRLSNVKSLDYGLFAESFTKAQSQGFDEALLINNRGHIFEASRANIFWIKDKVLYTPPLSSGCLNGITRQQVVKQARLLKIVVQEQTLMPQVLTDADAAFLTNSLIGIKPIEMTSIREISVRK